jgi:hypothetical protein
MMVSALAPVLPLVWSALWAVSTLDVRRSGLFRHGWLAWWHRGACSRLIHCRGAGSFPFIWWAASHEGFCLLGGDGRSWRWCLGEFWNSRSVDVGSGGIWVGLHLLFEAPDGFSIVSHSLGDKELHGSEPLLVG